MKIHATIRSLTLYFCILGIGLPASSFLAGAAQAQPLDPMETRSNDPIGSTVARFGTPASPPLPADFFGPGSDPFDGQIFLKGLPIDEILFGNASTLLRRVGDPLSPTAPIGSVGTVDVELVELNLIGTEPIVVGFHGGALSEQWEVYVVPSPFPVPVGSLTATKTHANGGTFYSTFYVQPLFLFTRTSDGMTLVYDTGAEGITPLQQVIIGSSWVHDADPELNLIAPSNGLFVPGVEESVPGDPGSQCRVPAQIFEPSGAFDHLIIPPELIPDVDPFVTIPGEGTDGTEIRPGL